jgi:hypothetical protein
VSTGRPVAVPTLAADFLTEFVRRLVFNYPTP